ncbi:MAG: DUF2341 domain-containing protein, partial [Opitutae bacterium]|nr:DUF2341 domain-containing protein [Opitutae bacterium]
SRTIAISDSSNFQYPKPVTIEFLEDGFPVELNATNTPGGFTPGDLSVTNGSISNIAPDVNDPGVYVVHLTPSDDNQTLDMNLSVTGSGVSTKTFGDTFSNAHAIIPYSVEPPEIHSPTLSHWAVGEAGNFEFITTNGRSFSISGEPAWMDFNSSTAKLSGTPPSGSTDTTINFSVENPHSTKIQNHQIKVFDPNAFTARMVIDPVGVISGENPQNLPGLILYLDGNQFSESNGTEITSWSDMSGSGHPLDRFRGNPKVISNAELQNKKVVRFNGLSQLYSTFDFGSSLTEYTVLALARHSGSERNTVIGSVGTEWVFGLGGGGSSYWKMGSEIIPPTSVDEDWHLYAGTLSSQGDAILWRDQFKVDEKQIALTFDSVPKYFALGGSGTNENFSTSEVAEVLIYNRVLSDPELSDLQNYLRSKWLGGPVENFPMMVRLNYNNVPAFGLNGHNSFSDPNSGGDLRIYDENNQELIYEIDEWNVSGETLIWVQVPELTVSSKIHAYWGNDSNITPPSYRTNGSLWSNYEGVWHFEANGSDSSIHSRTAIGNNGALIGVPALVGRGFALNGSNNLSANGYTGILGDSARSISLWMKSPDADGGLVGWGDATNRWDFGWSLTGPLVDTNNTNKEQGRFTLGDDKWHHVAVSYQQNSDLNQTMLFVDGKIVDAPNLSHGALVNTSSGVDLKIGSFHNGDLDANGTYDEVRISSVRRGAAWFKYSYDNQKSESTFLRSELNFLTEPVFESDLNVTVMKGGNMTFQVRTMPPAISYVLNSAPSGITINSATGVITGTPNWSGDQSFSVDASNAKGTASTSITIHSMDAKSIPVVSAGSVSDVGGRSAFITGELLNPGAASCNVTLYYGLVDENQSKLSWANSKFVGSMNQGLLPVKLTNLSSGETYFYRFEANNTDFAAWSEVGSFSTLSYDQGILYFHTGINEEGDESGLFWDKNGSGSKVRVKDANITSQNYIAPDGSSWSLSKATFSFDSDFYLGPNLDKVILEGVNSLSIFSEGNVSIGKSLSGAVQFAESVAHLPGGTLLDGHDAHYGDDPLKGLRLGRGQIGGFSGSQGPGKGASLGSSGASGVSGGGGSFAGEGGPGASGPSGITYGSGNLNLLIGGSGGGMGNLGEAAAGGGA